MKSVDECISGMLTQIEKRKKVDYGSMASVRQFNAAYHKCFRYAKYIDEHYPDEIDVLLDLCNHPDIDVVSHCAPMVLRLKNATNEQKMKALDTIRGLTQDSRLDSVSRCGFSLSLKQWEKEFM